MASALRARARFSVAVEHWPFIRPFHITGRVFDGVDVLVVTAEADGLIGRGEAAGVYYRGETAESIADQVRRVSADADVFGYPCAGQCEIPL